MCHIACFVSILVLVEEEVFLGGVVGPDILDGFVDVALVLYLLQVLDHLKWRAATDGVIDKFLLGCGPGSVFELRC